MLPFTELELMSICGSADVNRNIFVMEASYRNVSCSGKAATAAINIGHELGIIKSAKRLDDLTNSNHELVDGRRAPQSAEALL